MLLGRKGKAKNFGVVYLPILYLLTLFPEPPLPLSLAKLTLFQSQHFVILPSRFFSKISNPFPPPNINLCIKATEDKLTTSNDCESLVPSKIRSLKQLSKESWQHFDVQIRIQHSLVINRQVELAQNSSKSGKKISES